MTDSPTTELIADLRDAKAGKRAAAAQKLMEMGAEARPAVIPLLSLVRDENEEVREYAVAALEEIGAPRAQDMPPLLSMLNDSNAMIGYWAATLIGRMKGAGSTAAENLADTLQRSHHPEVKQRAAWALGQIGSAAGVAMDALQEAARSSDSRLARLASEAIVNVES